MKKIFTYIIFLFLPLISTNVYSENKVAYIDMEFVFNNSIAGKKITERLNEINNNDQIFFKKKEDELKKKEQKIISQRNILEKSELENMLKKLQDEATVYRKVKTKRINKINELKIKSTELLFKEIEPILIQYSNENSISILLQKKNIVIGKSELNKTNEILKIVDQKISEIKID